ncbi:uncharacterized protein LOC100374534 [Saccoglossus kowalevskii]|uniref:Synapse differentiation-inducing gene protein 1-like n=1 Tax=Saccoglossus kowalevskii TaxID=10224 RepID=A0ABM0GSP8_SACKO|nr:PREDICTED: synapse differentiation-inducing gene protein 1-like [Saccoglossus kowalevskii]
MEDSPEEPRRTNQDDEVMNIDLKTHGDPFTISLPEDTFKIDTGESDFKDFDSRRERRSHHDSNPHNKRRDENPHGNRHEGDIESDSHSNGVYIQKPRTYLVHSVVGCILCVVPLGLISLYMSYQVYSAVKKRDFRKAKSSSKCACQLSAASIICGIIILVLVIGIVIYSRSDTSSATQSPFNTTDPI